MKGNISLYESFNNGRDVERGIYREDNYRVYICLQAEGKFMSTYTKEKGISVLIIIMSALLAITGVPYMGESIFIIVFLLTSYLITACIVKKQDILLKRELLY